MRIKERMKKGFSALLAVSMMLSSVPLPAYATESCTHHPAHTAQCGYAEGSPGSACTHEHSEDCYAILDCKHTCGDECAEGCAHECTVENGCITRSLDCHHTHGDCGYSEGTAEVPCGHVHNDSCGYVEAVAGTPCANAETDPECDHTGDCGFVAAVEGAPCGHTEHTDCGYVPATEGTPCTHTHAVKVNSADSCYKLLCSHKDGGHDDACGYAQAAPAHECHYECAECANNELSSRTSLQTGVAIPQGDAESEEIATSAPDGDLLAMTEEVCDCGTDDALTHATTCAVYVAPENPQCYCAEHCTADNLNAFCDVCAVDYGACLGEDTAAVYTDAVSYIEYSWNGTELIATTKTVEEYTLITSNSYPALWKSGSYVVEGDVGISSSITLGTNAKINIILKDGATLTPLGGINVDADNECNIYAQSNGSNMGKIVVDRHRGGNAGIGGYDDKGACGTINIHGGTLSLEGSTQYEVGGLGNGANGSGGLINIYSGIVTVGSTTYLKNGTMNIYGGTVTVRDGFTVGDLNIYAGNCTLSQIPQASTITVKGGNANFSSPIVTNGTDALKRQMVILEDVTSTTKILGLYDNNGNPIPYGINGLETMETNRLHLHIPKNSVLTYVETAAELYKMGDNSYMAALAHTHSYTGTAVYIPDAEQHTVVSPCEDCPVKATQGSLEDHIYDSTSEYISNNDGTHKKPCAKCGWLAYEACTGGTATCQEQAICDLCGASYGEVDTTNHDSTVQFDNNGFCPHCNTFQPATLNEEGCYEISNAGQLYWFAEKVNGGANDINAILMENITINEKVLDAEGNLIADPSGLRQWTPIGHYLSADDFYSFDGIFDGNGKTITGLYHNDSYARYAGLFGYSTGTIQDLTLADTYINTTRSDGRAGSVAGLNEGTVRNCHLVSGYVSGNSQIGGIVGRMNAGSIEDCTNTGTVNSAANNAGGICGYSSAGSIDGCTNHGAISGEQRIGGISGWLVGRIQNSCNYGTIVGTSRVGGIVGITDGGDVTNCYNAGSVEATSECAGGILGHLQNSPTISYCYNSGMIQSPKDVGSIVGLVLNNNSNVKATIVNCYNDNTVFTGNFVGTNGGSSGKATITNCSGMTTEEFASGKVTYLLNGGSSEGVWKQTLGTDTYPGFDGGTVYYGNCPKDHYSNNAEEVKNHNLANGICTDCGDYDVPVQNAEGYYEIYTAGQLYWFAELVNSGDYDANAIVMADIDLKNNVWTTITPTGLYYNSTAYADAIYSGTFDGNGHVIKNFTVQGINGENCAVGLFGSVKGATVKNLGVDNMTFQLNGATDVRAAAIVGQMLDGSLIEDCYVVNSTLAPNNYIVGGIAACNYGGTIRNCFTRNVTISANSRCGNLVSDCRGDISNTDRPGTVTNCWTDADRVVGTQNVAANITDCHTNAEDALKSGEAAYNLGSAFGQTIGTDTYPVFDGATVYQVENIGCSAFGEYGYSNTNEPVSPEHQYTNGFCDCGDYEPAELKNDVYQIANAGNLFWLAEQRITGTISAFNAQLTADIVIPDDKVWTPFVSGDGSTFDGGGHSITFNQASGLFTSFNYSTLKNLILKGSVTANTTDYVGAVAASAFLSTIENVISYVDVTNAGTGNTGGLVGYFGGKPGSGISTCATIRNCAVYADISGQSDVGGIIGRSWGGTQYYRFYNCAYYGSLTGGTNTGALVGYNATGQGSSNPSGTMRNIRFENCYYCPQSDTIPMIGGSFKYDGIGVEGYAPITNCAYKSAEQFASGEVAYLLNGSSTDENVVWRQNVGSDSYPTFSGRVVWYQNDKYANDIIRVSISWTEMSFTYTDGQWDPETHTYGDGGWTADAGLGKITVTNIGGLIFPVKFSFTSTMAGVEGSFDIVDAALANNASITSTLSISGTPSETGFVDKQIGTVTVTIGKCDWEVGDTVNYVAIDGNTYETTVAALTENSAVLACWAAYDDLVTSQKNYLNPVGARHIVRDSAEWNNYLYPWINANREEWVVYLSSNDKILCVYKLSSAGLPTYGAASRGDGNIFYAWDITFAN